MTAYIDDAYIRPWPTECKTRGRLRNTFKTYIYVLSLQNEISSAESIVHPGRIYTSLARKGLRTDLATLKTEVDKLDIDKLVPVPVDLSKLSDVVKNDVVKKDVYDKLVTKVYNIDTGGFVLKTKDDIDKSELENKIPGTSSLFKKTDYDPKIADTEGKIPGVTNSTTKAAVTTVENKTPSVSNLVKKTDYETKLQKLKISLIIIVMTNILLLRNLMLLLLMILMQD